MSKEDYKNRRFGLRLKKTAATSLLVKRDLKMATVFSLK